MTDFSQNGEEAAILKWAHGHGPGRFLSIGETDGETFSNVRALALDGWSGVCVEPAAWAFDKLCRLYRDRPDVELVQAAVVPTYDEAGPLRFHYAHDLVSTTSNEHARVWREAADFHPVTVMGVALPTLLYRFGPFEFASIDTEGTSLDLLNAYRRHEHWQQLRFLCVEVDNGEKAFEIEQTCLGGWERRLMTSDNLLLERI